jgi:hypothetical protein
MIQEINPPGAHDQAMPDVDDYVEVCTERGKVLRRGRVEVSSPELKKFWLRDGLGERILVDVEYEWFRTARDPAYGPLQEPEAQACWNPRSPGGHDPWP